MRKKRNKKPTSYEKNKKSVKKCLLFQKRYVRIHVACSGNSFFPEVKNLWEVSILPNIKSAKKRVLVIETKTLRNKMIKSALKTSLKKFDAAVEAGDKTLATSEFANCVKKLDQAAAKHVLHKNNASRKKSQLATKLAKLA